MKKIIMFIGLCLFLVACSSDDNNRKRDNTGQWQLVQVWEYGEGVGWDWLEVVEGGGFTYTFMEDGTYETTDLVCEGTYAVEGSEIIFYPDPECSSGEMPYELSFEGSLMQWWSDWGDEGIGYRFERVN